MEETDKNLTSKQIKNLWNQQSNSKFVESTEKLSK